VTQNGGIASPFYVSGTSFVLPNATSAALVGVKATGSDSITLGQVLGNNILAGGIGQKNLPLASPWNISTNRAGPETNGTLEWYQHGGASGTDYNAIETDNVAGSTPYTVVVGLKNNNIAGGQTFDGAQDLDIRQKSLGMYLFIKAL